ncbi:MAG TPA: Type 1 glutamine amidotransferase-like domain-containing protein, partial [Dehalococcoidia bacterium]|nr:Type 1 glutamine amidotransferase-like domain-containing protein [Dehalococcoidia bacterium]
ASPLMVLERVHAEDADLIKGIEGAGVIYFTGGSPDHLLATVRNSLLLKAILAAVERGTVLAGSSAGAMVMGSLMRRPRLGQWVDALAVTPGVAVLPHHERSNPAQISRDLQEQVPADTVVFGIDARTGCLGGSGNWRVVGSGKVTVYRGKEWSVYQSGDNLPRDV